MKKPELVYLIVNRDTGSIGCICKTRKEAIKRPACTFERDTGQAVMEGIA